MKKEDCLLWKKLGQRLKEMCQVQLRGSGEGKGHTKVMIPITFIIYF